jgi:hypothetical protein
MVDALDTAYLMEQHDIVDKIRDFVVHDLQFNGTGLSNGISHL